MEGSILNDIDIWLSNVETMTYGIDFTVQQVKQTKLPHYKHKLNGRVRHKKYLDLFKVIHPEYFAIYRISWRLLHPEQVKRDHRLCAQRRKEQRAENKKMREKAQFEGVLNA